MVDALDLRPERPACGFCKQDHGRRQRTLGRIIPLSRSERWPVRSAHRTRRAMCRLCNERRAMCGHCVGAVACIEAVREPGRKRPSGSGFMAVYRCWAMGTVARTFAAPNP